MNEKAVNYSCPNCGGKLVFNAETQKFSCEWCASEFDESDLSGKSNADEDLGSAAAEEFRNGTNLYICDSCGAEIIADENTAAAFCCYCHSPVTLKGRLSGALCPEKIIPFAKTKENAIEGFKQWCGKKLFLPSGFTSQAALEKITGLYVPYWLCDTKMHGRMTAKAEITHSHRSGDTTITNHKEFMVDREIDLEFNGLPADGSKKLDDEMMDAIEPFDYSALKDFSMTYLQGFYADKYDVSSSEVRPRLEIRMNEAAKGAIMASIVGYSTVIPVSFDTRINNIKWHYAMLPVWLMSYRYKDKNYYYAMNGQTGKFSGIMPVSAAKITVGALIVALIAGLIGGMLFGLR